MAWSISSFVTDVALQMLMLPLKKKVGPSFAYAICPCSMPSLEMPKLVNDSIMCTSVIMECSVGSLGALLVYSSVAECSQTS